MERLTKWINNGEALCLKICGEKCVEGRTDCHKCKPFRDALIKLREYEDLEEQGLMLKLQCQLGTKIYYVRKCLAPSCKECGGYLYIDNCYTGYKCRIFEQKFDYRHLKAFGKTVFLTKEEAEEALQKMDESDNQD